MIRRLDATRDSSVWRASAKQRCANAYFRRAFFDGDFEVMTHAHGKNGQRAAKLAT